MFPFKASAILIEQPMGSFYIVSLPARLLLEVGYSDLLTAEATGNAEIPYRLRGTQREPQIKRFQEIGAYIDRDDSAFPNSIIIAANMRAEDGLVEEEAVLNAHMASLPGANDDEIKKAEVTNPINRRWTVNSDETGNTTLTIPTGAKLASIIDGQHRLWGFSYARVASRLNMAISCSIYMDLAKPLQAQLFATINSNQRKVNKSLTYELFGYNVEKEEAPEWAPDKLAVYLTRRLAADPASPLYQKIVISPRKDDQLYSIFDSRVWRVSTAVIVEGILRLISSNPKSDSNELITPEQKTREIFLDKKSRTDRSPLRLAYVKGLDAVIYEIVKNYLAACEKVFWKKATPTSFITKTVGVQALLDILRKLSIEAFEGKVIDIDYFEKRLMKAGEIDFSTDFYRNASGSGRSAIRQSIESAIQAA
ncbi:DGQHR domain-containing protein [Aureimonas sp. AU20]|uniref:DGQHR domain-containing protein n=1 Tax=Aureimonas sp. AU20 TaxID=1349819 RepID=UPI00071F9CD1|nr:DGQHR domain-containing protein [Aureimonas sp. AU20]ALN75792.1 hypothetical protein M673_23867 [Aureimonas sp. AU20]